MEALNEIITILMEQWKYDIAILSQPWMYWCLLIPAFFYMAFFFIKWTVLTAPLWLPLSLIVGAYKKL